MKTVLLFVFLLHTISFFAQENSEFAGRLAKSFDPVYAPFYHGVASGDALYDKVIIWTRVTPSCQVDSIQVEWFFGTDTSCTQVLKQGIFWTKEARDYTVKVDVTGLNAGKWYYYYFRAFNTNSIIGRTRTAPVGDNDSLRVAVVSGSNYNSGFFNAYKSMAIRNDYDAVLHLGDYIYEYGTNEYGTNPDRALEPMNEILTLSDYRMRYSHYRLDPDLRLAHQQYPWYVIWDDHEVADNGYKDGADNHTPGTEGDWNQRKSAGEQAFLEWIPLREINDANHPENKIHRTIKWGDLATFIFLDTRYEGRDSPEGMDIDDPNKTMLGTAQYNWLKNELYSAQYTVPVRWKLLGNQVMMAPLLVAGIVANKDQWDGYRAERQRLLNYINGMNIKNTVVLTGDIHTSWASDVPNPTLGPYGSNGAGSGTVEFITPSITSPSVDFGGGIGSSVITSANAHIKWVDLDKRGYYILNVNKIKTQADWYFIDNIGTTNFYETFSKAYYVNNNQSYIKLATVPTMRFQPNPFFAPLIPNNPTSAKELLCYPQNNLVLMGVYPNPFVDKFTLQLFSSKADLINLKISSTNGSEVFNSVLRTTGNDLGYHVINAANLHAGSYFLTLTNSKGEIQKKQLIKIK